MLRFVFPNPMQSIITLLLACHNGTMLRFVFPKCLNSISSFQEILVVNCD
ncbi:hypothetical protein HYC85_012168 [Camellia sinensis]|uniref:Uncharacterized protein n=1 Tax=Camellia sinensis TaxID=4442 RepID=A0A7J7HC23_CAMSI|nr:hypothetical protein HYC85_012168 [Camellia sinensis]